MAVIGITTGLHEGHINDTRPTIRGSELDVVMRWRDHTFLNSGKEPYVKKWAGLAEIETTIEGLTLFITFYQDCHPRNTSDLIIFILFLLYIIRFTQF